jgi:hypothetical protein
MMPHPPCEIAPLSIAEAGKRVPDILVHDLMTQPDNVAGEPSQNARHRVARFQRHRLDETDKHADDQVSQPIR